MQSMTFSWTRMKMRKKWFEEREQNKHDFFWTGQKLKWFWERNITLYTTDPDETGKVYNMCLPFENPRCCGDSLHIHLGSYTIYMTGLEVSNTNEMSDCVYQKFCINYNRQYSGMPTACGGPTCWSNNCTNNGTCIGLYIGSNIANR